MEENTTKETITVTKAATTQAQKIQDLMKNQNMTLEEALTVVNTKTPRSQIDRVALIKSMNSLTELRKARKTAYAKKSKSKDHPEAAERYQNEILAAGDRLNEIISYINSAETPWKAALEYGDTPDGALQYFITSLEQEVQGFFDSVTFTKSELKSLLQNTKINQDFVPKELVEPFQRRLANRDQRLQTLAARYTLMTSFKEDPESLKAATQAKETKEIKGTKSTEAPKEAPEAPKEAPEAPKAKKVKKDKKDKESK